MLKATGGPGHALAHDCPMTPRYCPRCGSEYVEGVDRCSDCDVALVDEPTDPVKTERTRPVAIDRAVVYTSGRRIDAEMVRGLLDAHGFDAAIWGGGLGAYRLESALTEVTGVPNAFNGYRVAVLPEEEEEARALLADVEGEQVTHDPADERTDSLLGAMRSRWALLAAALFLLVIVVLFGPPGLD